jgi:hypothetical protein
MQEVPDNGLGRIEGDNVPAQPFRVQGVEIALWRSLPEEFARVISNSHGSLQRLASREPLREFNHQSSKDG